MAVPLHSGRFRRYQGGNSLQHRVRRLLPQLRFPPLQLPHKPFLVPLEVEALVLLIPPRNVRVAALSARRSFWSRKAPSAAPNKPLVPEIISNLSSACCLRV